MPDRTLTTDVVIAGSGGSGAGGAAVAGVLLDAELDVTIVEACR